MNNEQQSYDLIFEYGNNQQHIELIDYLKSIWIYPERHIKYDNGKLELHTGGFSINEDYIDILSETIFWNLFWDKSERGGHYYFTIYKSKGNFEDDFDQVCE
jgi:hypothetical protein